MKKSDAPECPVAEFVVGQHQENIHSAGVPGKGKAVEIRGRAVDPEGVGIDHKERIPAERRQRPNDAAAGIKQPVALVGDDDLGPRSAGQMSDHLVGQIVHIDHRSGHPRPFQAVQAPIEQGLAGDRDQRLGPVVGQRPHPLAEPGRQHHRRSGDRAAHAEPSRKYPASR